MPQSNVIQFPVLRRYVGPKTEALIIGIARANGHEPTAQELLSCAKDFMLANQDLIDIGMPPLFNIKD
jgi:hypothetical protein